MKIKTKDISISLENGDMYIDLDNTKSQESFLLVGGIAFAAIMISMLGITISDKIKEKKLKKVAEDNKSTLEKIKNSAEFKNLINRIKQFANTANKSCIEATNNIKNSTEIKNICEKYNLNNFYNNIYHINSQKDIETKLTRNLCEDFVKGNISFKDENEAKEVIDAIELSDEFYLVNFTKCNNCDYDVCGKDLHKALIQCLPKNSENYEIEDVCHDWEAFGFLLTEIR